MPPTVTPTATSELQHRRSYLLRGVELVGPDVVHARAVPAPVVAEHRRHHLPHRHVRQLQVQYSHSIMSFFYSKFIIVFTRLADIVVGGKKMDILADSLLNGLKEQIGDIKVSSWSICNVL